MLNVLARIGDEFIILLGAPIDDAEVASFAQRMIALVNEPISFCGKVVQLGASIGVVMYPTDGHVPIQLMKRADSAMYSAKRAGKILAVFSILQLSRMSWHAINIFVR